MLHICVLLLYCCAYFKYLLYKTKIFLSVLYKIIQYLISPGLTWWYSGKESACSAGEPGSIPGLENSLEEKMSTHSSILAWEIPWTEEPGGLQFMGLQRVGHNWGTKHSTVHQFCRKLQILTCKKKFFF